MADTQATLSVGVKVVDQLTPEMKKIADNATRESGRAAQAVAGIGKSVGSLRSNLAGAASAISQVAGAFGLGAGFGLSFSSLVGDLRDYVRELKDAQRALDLFSRAQRSVGIDSREAIAAIRGVAGDLKSVYGGGLSDLVGLANVGRATGLDDSRIVETLKLAAELSSAYGVDLAGAMQTLSEATLGTQAGYEKLGQALGIAIRDADDAEKALSRLRLEAEKTRLEFTRSFGQSGFVNPDFGTTRRLGEIDRALGAIGPSARRPSAKDLELDATRRLGLAGFDRLVAQGDALAPRTTLYDKNYAAEVEMNQALLDLNSSVLELQKTIEARNQGANSPKLNGLAESLGVQRDIVAGGIERRYRETVSRNTLDDELKSAERDLQARRLYERDPRYGDRGVSRAVADIKAEYQDLNQRAYESVRYFASSLENNLGDAFTSILNGSKSVGDAMRALFAGLVADLTKEAGKEVGKFIVGAIFGAGSPAKAGAGDLGMVTGGAGFSGSSLIGGARFLSAYGHAPMRALAEGGVLYQPTLAVAGENGPEAFVPLRGGKIPVMVSGGGGTNVVHVHLNVSAWDSQDAARGVSKAMPQIVSSVQKALSSDRAFRNAVKSL